VKTNPAGFSVAEVARLIAIEAHAGDKNKHDQEPYLLHVSRVATFTRRRALMFELDVQETELAEATAWLHDVVEDTEVIMEQIRNRLILEGFASEADEICTAVDLLTKTKGQDNTDYYNRIRPNIVARVVKLADMHDNFSRNHKIQDEDTRLRMARKYSLGFEILG
jgi:(p)ppGpp synthase/HD superfamily hydrolase